MNQIMTDCWRCDRRKSSTQVVWPTVTPGAKIMIIGEAPGRDEDRAGVGFCGKAGDLLRTTIAGLGMNPTNDFSYANSVACFGGSVTKKPKQKETDACARHMWRAVYRARLYGTEVFMPAGKFAYKALLGVDCRITEESGQKKLCQPPQELWNAVRLEDFFYQHQLAWPLGQDGITPENILDPEFFRGIGSQALAMGFQLEEPPQLKVVPTLHPSYFLRDRFAELDRLESAIKVAKLWAETGEVSVETTNQDKDYKGVFDWEEALAYMDECIRMFERKEIPYVSYDLETVGPEGNEEKGALQPFLPGGRVLTIGLSHKAHFARVIYLAHPETNLSVSQQEVVAKKCCELLEKVPIVGANLKFDVHWSRFKLGAKRWTIAHDTQLMNYAVHLGTRENDLKSLTSRFLPEDAGFEEGVKQFLSQYPKGERSYDKIPSNLLTDYAAHDVDVVLQLIPELIANLQTFKQWVPYHLFGLHPYNAFIEMEQNGAFLDADIVRDLREEYEKKAVAPKEWFKTQCPYWAEWKRRRVNAALELRKKYKTKKAQNKPIRPEEIDLNFGSAEQVAELLFDIAQLPIWGELGKPKKSLMHIFPNGVPKTGEEVIENIKEDLVKVGEVDGPRVELIEKLLESRKDNKILSGYLKKAFKHCPVPQEPEWWATRHTLPDSRAYEAELYAINCQSAAYRLTSTRTARTSSGNPNIQQVNKTMKRMYIPRRLPSPEAMLQMGLDPVRNLRRLIANFDVGQAELRMAAVACQDPTFLAIMRDLSRDIHREIAAVAHYKAIDQITPEERRDTKAIVFGTLFGRSPAAVAAQLKIQEADAKRIQEAQFSMMPGMKSWIDARHEEAQTTGKVWTPTGRCRDLTMYANKGDRNRRAVNTPIQGSASDLTLWATGHIHHEMQRSRFHSLLWGFVHDSVVFDVFPQEAERLMAIAYHYFTVATPQQFTWYNVPLVLEFQFGTDWAKQVDAEYDTQTRQFKLQGPVTEMAPVFEAFKPNLTDIVIDPEWAQKVGRVDEDGKPDPEDVWMKAKFI